ncbi:hypothetical protein R6Q59_034144 [Mikania micrantha]
MASSKRSFKSFVAEEIGGFPHFLIWAVLEWILIASLYIDGFVAFLSSMFAKLFELEPPCVLCTRVDHALVRKRPNEYYNESICECHKKDISSLAYCYAHRKLSHVQHMCEACLLSFATENGSDVKIVLNLVDNLDNSGDGVPDHVKMCSCCGELPLNTSSCSKGYSRSFSNIHASVIATASSSILRTEDDSRYTELKFVSDSEVDMIEYDFRFSTNIKNFQENEEACRTLNLLKTNNFFGIPLTDSDSPRFAIRTPKKGSLEQSDLSSETNDETSRNGDSSLEQLRKQARIDQKALQSLSMELEEERSAAAVAANNAMAMITRLQEEKASVQMEALQYQRMMEEQAEYDQETIQILEDLLAKRDEHVKVMESQLENYREKYRDIMNIGVDECEAEADVDADEYYHEWRSHSSSSFGEKSEPETPFENVYEGPASPFEHEPANCNEPRGTYDEESLLDFANEKHQLYSMLKNLENHIESSLLENEDEDKKTMQESRATLNREVSLIKERLKALEADSGFLKQTAMTLQKGEKGAELLREIAQHLRKLCHSEDIYTSKS